MNAKFRFDDNKIGAISKIFAVWFFKNIINKRGYNGFVNIGFYFSQVFPD